MERLPITLRILRAIKGVRVCWDPLATNSIADKKAVVLCFRTVYGIYEYKLLKQEYPKFVGNIDYWFLQTAKFVEGVHICTII